ncbi:MAG: hypothetical protein RLZZ522_65 [Verrucomicrobiota bacterium]|jgi:hypothetical protein
MGELVEAGDFGMPFEQGAEGVLDERLAMRPAQAAASAVRAQPNIKT